MVEVLEGELEKKSIKINDDKTHMCIGEDQNGVQIKSTSLTHNVSHLNV